MLKKIDSVVKAAKVVRSKVKEKMKEKEVDKLQDKLEELDRTIRILKIKRKMEKEEGRSTTETSFLLRNAKEERSQLKIKIIEVQFN